MRGDPRNPSISRIAAEAGVSRAAVSLALRKHPRISAATRERIETIAKRLGWRPNPLLAQAMTALRAGRPSLEKVTLAWVTMYERRDGWKSISFFKRSHDGAVERARSTGYSLEHFWLGDANGRLDRLSQILYTRGITGLILAPLPQPGRIELEWDRFACAAVGLSIDAPRLHRVVDNHNASIRAAVLRLQLGGCKRIGFVIDRKFDQRMHGKLTSGYFWQMNDTGKFIPELMHRPDKLGEDGFARWVGEAKPDAIISGQPEVPGWLKGLGLRAPDDLAYVSLDLPSDDGSATGIYQDPEAVGACAVDTVAGQLIRHERGLPLKPRTVLVDGRWVEGATTLDGPNRDDAVEAARSILANRGNPETVVPGALD